MMSTEHNDKRLIEDYLPIQAISVEAAREKRQISGLHLWWARRPLVACRAAVYGALVPASRFVPEVRIKKLSKDDETTKRRKAGTERGLGRAAAKQFVARLCKYPVAPSAIDDARRHVLEAHAERLTHQTGKPITVENIVAGRAPRPMVLDMFAGGGAIPLEALRLGCEAYALDLNPVAHIVELCTLVYPQKYGKFDRTMKGCAKDGTWAGLADEVRYWGNWVLQKVKMDIGDLYPLVPDPEFKSKHSSVNAEIWNETLHTVPAGCLVPVAYLWTRTVKCKNPACEATLPLLKQTWLCKKEGGYVALKVIVPKNEKRVRLKVIEATSASGLGFDPESGSKGGNATCPFCGTVADSDYVMAEGTAGRRAQQPMAIVCARPRRRGKVYLSADDLPEHVPEDAMILRRIEELGRRVGMTVPNEPISPRRPSPNARGLSAVTRHGISSFGELFTARQKLCLLTFAAAVDGTASLVVG